MHAICSVYDQKARFFSAPFTSMTTDTATRDFVRAVTDSRGMVDKFPQDYELYCIGQFNDETGHVIPFEIPVLLTRGSDHIIKE